MSYFYISVINNFSLMIKRVCIKREKRWLRITRNQNPKIKMDAGKFYINTSLLNRILKNLRKNN